MPKSASHRLSDRSRRSRTRPTSAQEARRRQPVEWVDRNHLGTGEGQPVASIWSRSKEPPKA